MIRKKIDHIGARDIRTMAPMHTAKQIAEAIDMPYSTVKGFIKRNQVRVLNGNQHRMSKKQEKRSMPNSYVIPGIQRDFLTFEQMQALKRDQIFPTLSLIKLSVCNYYNILEADFEGRSKERVLVFPRHVYFWLASNMTKEYLKKIGEEAGHRDHTTVINGINVVNSLLSYDKNVQREVREIGGIIKNELTV